MSIEIRPVVAADHQAWLPLWQGYQRFYMTEIPAETSAATWQRFLDPAEPMGAALAWQGDQAIGLVHWVIHRSTWIPATIATCRACSSPRASAVAALVVS